MYVEFDCLFLIGFVVCIYCVVFYCVIDCGKWVGYVIEEFVIFVVIEDEGGFGLDFWMCGEYF